jgi:nucleoside-diphosphate-sugar epimerase
MPRVAGLYGPNQHKGLNVLAQMDCAAVLSQLFDSPLQPAYRYEVTYVKDIARGVFTMLDAPSLAHPVYNVGSKFIPEADVRFGGSAQSDIPPRALMAVDRFATETGLRTAWIVEQGVRQLATWRRIGANGRPIGHPPASAEEL